MNLSYSVCSMSPYQKKLALYRKRREKIIALAEKHGIREAARRMDISTQRVSQIIKAAK